MRATGKEHKQYHIRYLCGACANGFNIVLCRSMLNFLYMTDVLDCGHMPSNIIYAGVVVISKGNIYRLSKEHPICRRAKRKFEATADSRCRRLRI